MKIDIPIEPQTSFVMCRNLKINVAHIKYIKINNPPLPLSRGATRTYYTNDTIYYVTLGSGEDIEVEDPEQQRILYNL